ncbi:MAG: hypothetical protein P4L33_07190 [Capsulimonadaceae bacterium]|nr:hypothetical protein [Capsulimonadaceae bacterium]
MLRYDLTAEEDQPVEQSSYVVYVDNMPVPKRPPIGIPKSQEEVDEIPVEHRGLSFFTSMPASDTVLIAINVPIGESLRMVHALPTEVEAIHEGRMPLVRSFGLNGSVIPWYDWADYHPYLHYFEADNDGWAWLGSNIVACWRPLATLSEDIDRYMACEADTSTAADLDARQAATPWRVAQAKAARMATGGKSSKRGPLAMTRRRLLGVWKALGPNRGHEREIERIRRELVDVLHAMETLGDEARQTDEQTEKVLDAFNPLIFDLPGDPHISAERLRLEAEEARLREELDRLILNELEPEGDKPRRWIKAVGINGNSLEPLHVPYNVARTKARRHQATATQAETDDASCDQPIKHDEQEGMSEP